VLGYGDNISRAMNNPYDNHRVLSRFVVDSVTSVENDAQTGGELLAIRAR
jgi:hypothetical protein